MGLGLTVPHMLGFRETPSNVPPAGSRSPNA